MSFVPLPNELVDDILKYISSASDTKTLRACSLVCHVWWYLSRPYIFHTVTITVHARLIELEDLLDRERAIGLYVRSLTIRPEVGPVSTPSPWLESIVVRLPGMLPNLRTIQLIKLYDFGDYITEGFIQGFTSFTSVVNLAFDNCSLSLPLVFAVASALPDLRHLRIGFIMPLHLLPGTDTLPRIHSPKLHSLHLDIGEMYPYGMQEITGWIMDCPSRHSLRSLRICAIPVNMGPAGKFIEDLGPQLNELDLKLDIRLPAPVEAEGEFN